MQTTLAVSKNFSNPSQVLVIVGNKLKELNMLSIKLKLCLSKGLGEFETVIQKQDYVSGLKSPKNDSQK